MPFNLTIRILFDFSASLSICYFIMSLSQIWHILWNYKHPSNDWTATPENKRSTNREGKKISSKQVKTNLKQVKRDWDSNHMLYLKNKLHLWFWFGLIVVALLVIIFPILHL